jgi:hypothetical protein
MNAIYRRYEIDLGESAVSSSYQVVILSRTVLSEKMASTLSHAVP